MKNLEDYLYYEEKEPDLKIYLGDCLEVMSLIRKVDHVITDPPYGIGFKYDKHDDSEDAYSGGYGEYIKDWFSKCCEKINEGGHISVAQTTLNFKNFWNWFGDDIRIFIHGKNFVQLRGYLPYAYDPIIIKFIGKPKESSGNRRDYYIGNTAGVISNLDNIEKKHPSPKPLDSYRYLVNAFTSKGDTVLDPFLGSGTTLVACKELNRNGIGIEISEKYCEIAKKRLKATCKPLFTDANFAAKNLQTDLPLTNTP